MIRRIIHIDDNACNGCGACAAACHEGAIQMIDGKARLTREDYCDGLGDCLPACPVGAITFEEREAPAYDEQAVRRAKAAQPCSCPGAQARALPHEDAATAPCAAPSRLAQWPVQIRLAPVRAPWLDGAELLIAADCTAYAYGSFHEDFIRGRVALIGCPKLDATDYAEKLTAILEANNVRGVTVARMEVPCCGGMEHAVRRAIAASGKAIPCRVVTITTKGGILA
ncbi:MAG: ATP-binding protein [Candidatus Ventricola sp.]